MLATDFSVWGESMGAYDRALALSDWLKTNGREGTIAQMAGAGLMSKRDLRSALDYGMRRGVFEAVEHSGRSADARVSYQLTGVPLLPPDTGKRVDLITFDGLLGAFGIAAVPPMLKCTGSLRHTTE
ncbi:hypothetical protein [Burkholderia sp. Ac-20365]|uniref:hypothetical protein n=1 Tax=Burkholderia sp. Ac-20365 TaxID=2703897 RepID=UPI00197C1024|nr:hypothetical protein [Burkholderia sp. Ac-20365]MBN3761045.1 hypothetical protein [Burkholderia sp. Ac-20365]